MTLSGELGEPTGRHFQGGRGKSRCRIPLCFPPSRSHRAAHVEALPTAAFRMASGVDGRKPLSLPKRSKLYNHVWAAPARVGWRPLYDICRTRMDAELMCLDPENASTALLTECHRAVAQPWRNAAVLVWHPAACMGDVPAAGCVCVTADQQVKGSCAFATALDALQNCLRRHGPCDGRCICAAARGVGSSNAAIEQERAQRR